MPYVPNLPGANRFYDRPSSPPGQPYLAPTASEQSMSPLATSASSSSSPTHPYGNYGPFVSYDVYAGGGFPGMPQMDPPPPPPPHHPSVPTLVSTHRPASTQPLKTSARNAPNKKRSVVKSEASNSVHARRQKRLERNRESARLSRRRRKQYLEVLEERVEQLSTQVDQRRREHVKAAIPTLSQKRTALLAANGPLEELDRGLSRAGNVSKVIVSFHTQQLKSLSFASNHKFTLWLTLQNDSFFRGGRAASERLSAARIGERMLSSGSNKATPSQAMWPLFCNEVGLSYDQEERVRGYQKNLLLTEESWLDRHAGFASSLVMDSTHDATQALLQRIGQREQCLQGILSREQRRRLLQWSDRNRDRIAKAFANRKTESTDPYTLSKSNHLAANLYVMNHRLQTVFQVARAPPFLSGAALKRLSRRPSFESLGCRSEKMMKDENNALSRDSSFCSSGSLKRSASELTADNDEMPAKQEVVPAEAEKAAAPLVEKTLGHLKPIIPRRTQLPPLALLEPLPAQVLSHNPTEPPRAAMAPPPAPPSRHNRGSSFLPPYLNVVPEEMFPAEGADDLFLNFVEDWAIGGGVDMDTSG